MNIPSSRFVPVTADLIEQIRQWRNKPRIRENMLDDTLIDPNQQSQWFDSLDKLIDKRYLVFLQNDKPIGMLYFSDIDNKRCNWGCYIGEDAVWPGSGLILEIAALDFAFNILKTEQLVAEVFEDNLSPIRIHKVFGYQLAEKNIVRATRSGHNKQLSCFIYTKFDWLANKEQVLAKLPRQIKEAAQLIKFS